MYKYIMLVLMSACVFAQAYPTPIPTVPDTTSLKGMYGGDGTILYLQGYSTADTSGGGWFITRTSSGTTGTNYFDHPSDGRQWVRQEVDALEQGFVADTAALKQLALGEGKTAYLKQLSAANTNGGGWWTVIDSTYNEAYSIIATGHPTAALQWVRVDYLDYHQINLRWSTVGDNSNDDVEEIQAAFDLMTGADVLVSVSEDTFLVSASLTIDYSGTYNFNGVTIVAKSTFDTTGNIIEIGASDITINDLYLNGYNYTGRGIYGGRNYSGVTINRANIIQCEQGIRFDEVGDFRIRDCTISDTLYGGIGMWMLEDNNDENWIESNNIISMTGIQMAATTSSTPNYMPSNTNYIINNIIKHPTQLSKEYNSAGIVYTRNSNVTIQGNNVGLNDEKSTGFRIGISVTGDTLDYGQHTIADNNVYWTTDTPLEFYDADDSFITNNYFLSDSGNSEIRNSHNLTIEGNIFQTNYNTSDSTLLNTIHVQGSTSPGSREEADGRITNLRILGNTISGGYRGILINTAASANDSTHVGINISNNFFTDQEVCVALTGASNFQDVKIDGNQGTDIAGVFTAMSSTGEFNTISISGNQVHMDTTLADSTVSMWGTGAINFVSADGVNINDNYIYGGGKTYPVRSTGTLRYGTVDANVFEGFANNRLSLAGRVKIDTSNTYVYLLPVQDYLLGWWAAEDIVATDGDSISTWPGRTSVTNDLYTYVDSSASRPTYQENILNEFPAVRFDGINDIMRTTTGVLATASTRTVFIVLANQDSTGNDGIFGNNRIATFYGNALSYGDLDTLVLSSRTNAGVGWDIREVMGADSVVISAHWEDNSTWLRVNGVSLVSDTDSTLHVFGSTSTILGGKDVDLSTPGSFLGADILEIIVYNALFDTTETSNIQDYLNTKYTIY